MLGEKIGEEQGKVTARRVLPGDADKRFVRVEINFEAEATIYGVPAHEMGTYTIVERIPGQLYGEGQGLLMTAEGEGIVWTGHGVGHPREDGSIAFAASVTFQTSSAKLAKLNAVLGVIEHETDMAGNVKTIIHEWTTA